MYLRSLAALCVFLLPLAVAAQEKTVDELDKEVQALKTQVEALTKTVGDAAKAHQEKMDEMDQMVQRLDKLGEVLQAQATNRELSLDSGNLTLSAKMQNDEFRQQMYKAVHDTIKSEGEVVIRNKMSTQQRIRINQKDYDVEAGNVLTLSVPVGTLTAQLPGQALTNWTITAPKYKQVIDIVPNSETQVTAYRPVDSSTVTTMRPLTSTPVYSSVPVYSAAPVYVQPWTSYYLDPFTGAWYSY